MSASWQDFLSPSNMQQFFQGLDFPCSKQELYSHAEDQNAPQQVLDAIEKMPDKQYNSISEVTAAAAKSVV